MYISYYYLQTTLMKTLLEISDKTPRFSFFREKNLIGIKFSKEVAALTA